MCVFTNALVLVLGTDCEFNMCKYNTSVVDCLTYDFIKGLRAKRPDAKVLLIEGHDETKGWINQKVAAGQNGTRNGYRAAYNKLLADGVKVVWYLDGSGKLGGPTATDFEAQVGAVAGVHVSDFAFAHFAQYIGDKVLQILNGTAAAPAPVAQLPMDGPPHPHPPPITQWKEASELGLEGKGWPSESPAYGRLPARDA